MPAAARARFGCLRRRRAASGAPGVTGLTHGGERLPSGQTAVIGLTKRTVSINGASPNYVGADVVVLDKNFQVSWVWGSFD